MKTITLGPKGTYAELAAMKLQQELNINNPLTFYSSIDLCFKNLEASSYLVLPFDNSIDGYVQRTLDLLYENDYVITHQTSLPISFSLVSNENNLDNIKHIYVQFKAHQQCLNFLTQFDHFSYITTDSNVTSLDLLLNNQTSSAAIIPSHLISSNFELIIHQIHDTLDNRTRFAFIQKDIIIPDANSIKSMIVLSPNFDKPGLLHDLLFTFKSLEINLSSIISRPKKNHAGIYNFFIEVSLDKKNYHEMINILNENQNFKTKIIGVYT